MRQNISIIIRRVLIKVSNIIIRFFFSFLIISKNQKIRVLYWNYRSRDIHATWGSNYEDFDVIKLVLMIIKPKKILDIGCGSGRLFPLYDEFLIPIIVGQDISSNALKIARTRNPQPNIILTNKEISKLEYHTKYFDLIISNRVLSAILPENIDETLKFLSDLSDNIYLNELSDSDYISESNYWFKHDYLSTFERNGFHISMKGEINKQRWFLFSKKR